MNSGEGEGMEGEIERKNKEKERTHGKIRGRKNMNRRNKGMHQ